MRRNVFTRDEETGAIIQTEIEQTAYRLADGAVLALDADAPTPEGATAMTETEVQAVRDAPTEQPADPVEKLRAFLAANPDVAGILK